MKRTASRFAAWLAIAAIVLNGVLPLLAQAKAAGGLVPVCSADGITHYVELGGSPDAPQAGHVHCPVCTSSAERPVVPAAFACAGFTLEACGHPIPAGVNPWPDSPELRAAQPRAPPVSVDTL